MARPSNLKRGATLPHPGTGSHVGLMHLCADDIGGILNCGETAMKARALAVRVVQFWLEFARSHLNESMHGGSTLHGGSTMLKSAAIMLSALVLFCIPLGATNAQNPVEEALKDCSKEIKAYCSSVTPGSGRLVSCAKAHEDKLSSECIYAINRAGYWVDFLARTLVYVASQCEADALKYCPDVKLGEERVLNCLRENNAKLNKYCGLALGDVGKQ